MELGSLCHSSCSIFCTSSSVKLIYVNNTELMRFQNLSDDSNGFLLIARSVLEGCMLLGDIF